MFGSAPFEPIDWDGVEAAFARAIRSSASGHMARNSEVVRAGICAKHLTDHLALAGFVVMRRIE